MWMRIAKKKGSLARWPYLAEAPPQCFDSQPGLDFSELNIDFSKATKMTKNEKNVLDISSYKIF